eukprot:COSAG02_NODE_45473_length_357_cov_0.441860_1_plen_75_part_00
MGTQSHGPQTRCFKGALILSKVCPLGWFQIFLGAVALCQLAVQMILCAPGPAQSVAVGRFALREVGVSETPVWQ